MMMVMVVVVGVITQGMDPRCDPRVTSLLLLLLLLWTLGPSPVWGATGLVAYLHDLVTP